MKHIFLLLTLYWQGITANAQVQDICKFMKAADSTTIESDTTVIFPRKNKVLQVPIGWNGKFYFEDGPSSFSLSKNLPDSSLVYFIGSEAWLVEFHEEYVARVTSESVEYCTFSLNEYPFTVYRSMDGYIHIFYQIARIDKDKDGRTWFFKFTSSQLTDMIKTEIKSIIIQIVNIYEPSTN